MNTGDPILNLWCRRADCDDHREIDLGAVSWPVELAPTGVRSVEVRTRLDPETGEIDTEVDPDD